MRSVFLLRRPSPTRLAALVTELETMVATYDEVGGTRPAATAVAFDGPSAPALPGGYHHQRAEAALGTGDAVWRAAVDGIRTWQMQRRSGIMVVPGDPPIAEGTTLLGVAPVAGPVRVLIGCRIVWTVGDGDGVGDRDRDRDGDRGDRELFGFGYGTLPTHPERGEEAFVVARDAAGVVTVRIVAFSAPQHPLVRLGGPVARRQQAQALRGYLDAMRAHVGAAI